MVAVLIDGWGPDVPDGLTAAVPIDGWGPAAPDVLTAAVSIDGWLTSVDGWGPEAWRPIPLNRRLTALDRHRGPKVDGVLTDRIDGRLTRWGLGFGARTAPPD